MAAAGRPGTRADRFSVVIPCRDRADLLRACLEAVVAQPESLLGEVVVVDASDGGEVAAVVRDFPRVRHLAAGAQVLPGPARNLGAAATADPFLAFLDADCRPAPAWLGAAAETLATPGARMVGGPVLDARPGHPVAAAAHFLQNAERGPGRPAGAAPYLPGPNLAMRRAAFQAVGPFVDRAAEDYLLTRTAAVRWPGGVRYAPGMVVHHAGVASWRDFWSRHLRLGHDRARAGPEPAVVRRLGASRPAALTAGLARFGFIAACTARWHPAAGCIRTRGWI